MNIQKMRYKYNKKIAPATIGLESYEHKNTYFH